MNKQKISIFWFRRDLRLDDNVGLYHALNSGEKILPIFIFDTTILQELPKDDARVSFIYQSLKEINNQLKKIDTSLLIKHGDPIAIWSNLFEKYSIKSVFTNHDYEPYAIQRDLKIEEFCIQKNIDFITYKDQVVFEKNEILKKDGKPYTIYTPYKNKWLALYNNSAIVPFKSEEHLNNFLKQNNDCPTLKDIGFVESTIKVKPHNLKQVQNYADHRDIPSSATSDISPHLRFGTVGIRKLVNWAIQKDAVYTSELIWREFFMQILYHFPKVVTENFKPKYNLIQWRNNQNEFDKWCKGKTGYAIVDAGMRQLNQTGYMHNRVRMVVASFLCKHLLIDWRLGEAYFAKKLLDYELSSNNGNWQWVAGTGCDSAPYFRVFNPMTQQKKFDKDLKYIKKWIPNFDTIIIPEIVEHKYARERFLKTFKEGLQQYTN